MKKMLVLPFLLWSGVAFCQQFLRANRQDTSFFVHGLTTFTQLPATFSTSKPVVPQNFHTQHFGFFCRQELKMQEANIPVTFRLGSMDYCNYLEQKTGYR